MATRQPVIDEEASAEVMAVRLSRALLKNSASARRIPPSPTSERINAAKNAEISAIRARSFDSARGTSPTPRCADSRMPER